MRRLRDAALEPLFLALLSTPLLLFPRVLVDETFFFRDLHLFAWPQRLKVGAALRAGGLPLWDATLHGGQPLLANPNNTALYPTALLQALLPAATAFNLEILFHVALAAAGAYLLARALGLRPAAATAAAFVYAFCGPTLSLASLLNRHLGAAWAPWILLLWHRWLEDRRASRFAFIPVAIALQLVAGFPELSIATAALLAVWALTAPEQGAGRLARAAGLCLALGAGLALAAPQIIPAVRLLPWTVRGQGFAPGSALIWSVDPRRLIETAVPGVFGRLDALSDSSYLGRRIEDAGFPYVPSLAFGAGALALAACGLGGAAGLSARRARVLGAFAAGAVFLSLGRHIPGVASLAAALPGLVLRYPEKLVSCAALPVALLTGAGLEAALAGPGARLLSRLGGGLAAMLLAAALLETVSPGFAATAARRVFDLDAAQVPAVEVAGALAWASLAAALAAAAGIAAGGRGGPRVAAALACAAVCLPLLGQVHGVAPVARRALLAEPPAAPLVRRAVGAGLLYRTFGGAVQVDAPSNDIVWLARHNVSHLARHMAAGFGIPVAFHEDYDGLAALEVARVGRFVNALPWERRVEALASAGVTAVLSDEPIGAPGLEPLPAPPGLFLYRVAAARPAYSLQGGGPGDAVTELASLSGQRRFRVVSTVPSTLLIVTPWFDGWRAFVDGVAAPVLRANVYMTSVRLPAGARSVELRYEPPGFRLGVALSGLTLAALAAAVVAERRRLRRAFSARRV